ncbi:MAG: MATE family efflux transporter [Eubacteriales bacterium]|jgi:putative MATE family efflux protein|nr:MATE family efflux transporter [Eubacteriales bacterium]
MNIMNIVKQAYSKWNDKLSPESSKVAHIAWPVLVEVLLSSLFSMVDMMMLGNIPGKELANQSVAAVGIVNQPLYVGIALIQSLNVGGTAMIARYLGAKQNDRIEQSFKHVILLSFTLLTIPTFLICQMFASQIMVLLGAQAPVVTLGVPYFRLIMTGFLFSSFSFSFTAALRGAGETRTPMRINLIANFTNVIGNAVLIYGLFGLPALGIVGAGISTAVSNVLAFILLLRHVLSGKSQITLKLRNKFRFSKDTIYNLVKIGVPASGEQLVMRAGVMIFVRIVAGLGTTVFAAHQIALSILALSFNPGMAFGIASASLVGFSLGNKEPDMAEKYSRSARHMGSIVSTGIAVFFFVLAPQLAGLFNKDPEVIRNAVLALRIIALIQPFQSSQLILAGALRGAGDTFWTLIATIAGVLVIRIGLGLLFVNYLGWGIVGAWSAVLVDQLIRWVIVYGRFRGGKWKHIVIR